MNRWRQQWPRWLGVRTPHSSMSPHNALSLAVAAALLVLVALSRPVSARIAATSVQLGWIGTVSFSSNGNSVTAGSGYTNNVSRIRDGSIAQSPNSVCLGMTAEDNSNKCYNAFWDLGTPYNVRAVRAYLPTSDPYGNNFITSANSGVDVRLSSTSVRAW